MAGSPLRVRLSVGALCILALAWPRAGAQPPTRKSLSNLAKPFEQYAPGLLARTVYVAEGSGPFRVEVWDLLVGPAKRTEPASLPGGAILEIRSGVGLVAVDQKASDVRPGSMVRVDEGSRLVIENRDKDQGLSIRAIVIAARQR
jgi:hypothetical protein